MFIIITDRDYHGPFASMDSAEFYLREHQLTGRIQALTYLHSQWTAEEILRSEG